MRPEHVLITGASSGIGASLALAYAEPGRHLTLIGRNAERLAEVAAATKAKGASVTIGQLDIRDREAAAAWLIEQNAQRPFDLVIANAGITTGLAPRDLTEKPDAVRALLSVNLIGVLNTVEPLILPMCKRGQGHLAFVGSIAGLHGLPYSPAYCMSKAAIQAYTEALRGRLERQGVCITLIIPGFVKTPLNDSIHAIKPLEITADEAALRIKCGLDRGKAIIAFPWLLYALARLGQHLPARLYDKFMARFEVNMPETQERSNHFVNQAQDKA
jgi:short-subunit dehydrogenase